MATGFIVNAHRFDPYKNFKFRFVWDGRVVMGVSKISALKRTTQVTEHREGGDPSTVHKSPGQTKYEAITMERGITHDVEFEKWANLVHPYSGDTSMDLAHYKHHCGLQLLNEKGHIVKYYKLFFCWVSEFTAVPDLDASANAVAIESIKIELEGWERDVEIKEPDEKSPVPAG